MSWSSITRRAPSGSSRSTTRVRTLSMPQAGWEPGERFRFPSPCRSPSSMCRRKFSFPGQRTFCRKAHNCGLPELTLGAAPEDVIGILSEIGRDTAGALSIGQPGSTDPGDWRPIGSPENLERIISELPPRPPDDAEGRKLSRQGWMGRKRAPRHRPLSQRADPICGAVDSGPALAPHPHSRRPVMARWACAARSAASYGAGLTSISNTIRLSNRFQSVRRSAQLPFLG